MRRRGPVVHLYRARPRPGPARWVLLPLDVVTALRRERRWQPVLPFYLLVVGVALVPALGLGWATGAWSAALVGVPLLAVTAAFLWSLSSSVGGGRARRAVREAVSPRRAALRQLGQEVEDLDRALRSLPLVAPRGWDGPVQIAGLGYREDLRGRRRAQQVVLVADADGSLQSRPRVRVEVSAVGEPVDEHDLLTVAVRDEEASRPPEPDPDGDPASQTDRLAAWLDEQERRVQRRVASLAGEWRDSSVPIDGAETPVRRIDLADATVLLLELEGHPVALTVTGGPVAGLRLTSDLDAASLVTDYEARRLAILTPPSRHGP